MRIGGMYVGLGLGDSSDEIAKIKVFMRKKFSYAVSLDTTPVFGTNTQAVVADMQQRYLKAGKLAAGSFISGVINLETKYVMGYAVRPSKAKPVVFTVEGHMSSMWEGPCAFTAQTLEQQGVAKWQPVGYNNTVLPFDNASGINELCRLLDDKILLPPGTPWGGLFFSQGGIVGCETFIKHIFPVEGKLHWRLKDCRGVIAFGNPYRENGVVAPWVPDPPKPGTQGISNVRMSYTPSWWREVSRTGDLYAENEVSTAGRDKTAVYMAVQNQWSGSPEALVSRLTGIMGQPALEFVPLVQAVLSGAMFIGNMAPHGAYDLAPCVEFMRSRFA